MTDSGRDDRVEDVAAAMSTASRVLVGIALRSLDVVSKGLTLPQFRTLVMLATRGPMKLVALAEHLAVNPSTAMRAVDRLVAADLVSRRLNPAVRREVILDVTRRGRRVVERVMARREAEITEIVGRMPPAHRGHLVDGLRAFIDAAGEPTAVASTAQPAHPFGWT